MKTSDFLLLVAQGIIKTLKDDLAKRNADYEQEKRRDELRRGSIDVEYRVKE